MSRRGFLIADAYVSIHADEDALRKEVRDLPGHLGPDVDKAGSDMGSRLTKGLADKVEALSGKVASARQQEKKAADAVTLAESKLNEARQSGTGRASTLLGLEQKLAQAQDRLSLSTQKATALERKHAEAQGLLSKALKDAEGDVGKAAENLGKDAGLKIKMGMTAATSNVSPLIVAAIAGGLAAGAPVMLGAVGVLFAGLGAFLASQNEAVHTAWANTFASIKNQAMADAGVLTGTMLSAAQKVANGFRAIRPELQDAFAASGPIIDKLTTGLVSLVQNLLPGMVHALQAAGPVFDGLSVLLGDIGTGLSNFFDILSQHSGASGAVFSQLGQLLAALLPIIAQIAGAGVELASAVLPSVVAAFRLVNSVLSVAAPLLPMVLGGFLAFKAVGAVTPLLERWSLSLATAASGSSAFAGMAGKASGAISTVSSALPVLGTALGVIGGLWSAGQKQVDDWASAMLKGGAAADVASAQIQKQTDFLTKGGTGFISQALGVTNWATALGIGRNASDNVTKSVQAQIAAMDPLTAAQTIQTQTLNKLNDVLKTHSADSAEGQAALAAYRSATDDVTAASDREQAAIHGVTDAMVEQANEALASIDAGFALQQAQNAQRDAEIALRDAIKQHGVASTQAHDAQQAYNKSIYDNALASAQANDDLKGLKKGTDEYASAVDSNLLVALEQMQGNLKGPARTAVDGFIQKLRDAGVTTDGLIGKTQTLGAQHPTPTLDVNPGPATSKTHMVMDNLSAFGGMRPVPVADLNTGPARNQYNVIMGMLGTVAGQRPTPTASVRDNASPALRYIDSLLGGINGYHATATVTTYYNSVGQHISGTPYGPGGTFTRAAGGPIHAASGRLVGPGDGSVDTIPAVGPGGSAWALANNEWIIRAMSAAKYGDRRMAAVNAGTATVLLPPEVRATSASGPAPVGTPTSGIGNGGDNRSIVINGGITLQGVWDFSDPAAADRIVTQIRDRLIRLERARR